MPKSCHQTRRRSSRDSGFSLLELMVVVVIMSILALVIVPRVIDRPDQARIARVQSDLAVLQNALNLYKLDNLQYPTTEQGLTALVERPTRPPEPQNWAAGGYIDRLPSDPWGGAYQYLSPGVHGDFDVFSYGADGRTGGDGADADLGTWSFD
ncbi:general secretion pathway protein G [Roseivivax lentus]|uniref:Type II secretion system core protein G n=1 Tax=Roseivivax lentus TaxID=633194 RepID=A0A1N7NBD0_9RHOB|nr:type II secretion system major pseudopilin GspG [Roseivivax lentus]SIS95499.1 general secretion pathway protein G [Roseivivax lentus]